MQVGRQQSDISKALKVECISLKFLYQRKQISKAVFSNYIAGGNFYICCSKVLYMNSQMKQINHYSYTNHNSEQLETNQCPSADESTKCSPSIQWNIT